MTNNEEYIIKWLKVCPDFEIIKMEVNPTIDKSLIWGRFPDRSFNGVSFAELKYFIVDSYNWSAGSNLKNDQ